MIEITPVQIAEEIKPAVTLDKMRIKRLMINAQENNTYMMNCILEYHTLDKDNKLLLDSRAQEISLMTRDLDLSVIGILQDAIISMAKTQGKVL